jgi:hypothetical protein
MTIRLALRDAAVASTVFVILGFTAALALFWRAPKVFEGSIVAALAAGLCGLLGWAALCSGTTLPAWWRVILAGVLVGIMIHPVYFLTESFVQADFLSPGDLFIGSLFSLIVAGIITIPAGIVAAALSRALIGRLPGRSA